MPYVATPVNRINRCSKEHPGSDTYFGHKGTIELANGRAAHLEYCKEGPKFTASIFGPSPDGAGTDAPESSTRAGNGIRPFNMIVLDAPRSFLQKLFDWLFHSLPFNDALPLSEKQGFAFNKLERDIVGSYGQGDAPPSGEPAQTYTDLARKLNGLAAAKRTIRDVRGFANKGQPESWPQIYNYLWNPLVADMVWADPKLLGKIATLCRNSDSLLQLARTFDVTGEDPTPGLEHLIGLGGDMETIFEGALFDSCRDLSCADAIAKLRPFMKAPIGQRLFGIQPSSGHCKALRNLLLSKVSTPDEALQMANLFPWGAHVAMKRIQIDAGVQTRMRAHINATVTNALPPDFGTVEGQAFETFKRFIEVELPSLFHPSSDADRPALPAWHLFQTQTLIGLAKAEERYRDQNQVNFTKLVACLPALRRDQSPAPATH
ncbi:hypothetical protein [Paracidovorax citrulli]